jgi:predicted Zn-dependent peptidase
VAEQFYDKTVTADGVEVITETIDAVRSVTIGLWFAVGSRDETPDEAGMSHFMEHMMFKGTPTRTAAEISEHFDRLGGELNAFTSREHTCFYARVLDEHVDDAMEVLSDMVVNATNAEDAITPEREVVLEEIARHEDQPDDQVHDLFSRTLLGDHPLALPVLGNRASVSSFDRPLTCSFKERHYVAGNCIVAAAGRVSHERVLDLTNRFLTLPVGDRTVHAERPALTTSQVSVLTKDTEQAHICWGVQGLITRDEQRFALGILNGVLGGGMASRLFQEVREKRGLAYSVFSYPLPGHDVGQFAVYAGTRPSNAPEVIRVIRDVVHSLRANGVTADELARAKDSTKGHLVLALESTRSRMNRMGGAEACDLELLSIDEAIARTDAVTLEDVKALAERLFSQPEVLTMIAPFVTEDVSHLLD